jgi:hypothetical protein
MEGGERDSTQDWLLPDASAPPLVSELERRIDEAVDTARASEAAVMTVGAAALEAAKQAHRAAELAERASAAVLDGLRAAAPAVPQNVVGLGDKSLRSFTERADRVVARLRALVRIPARSRPASAAAGRRRSAR